ETPTSRLRPPAARNGTDPEDVHPIMRGIPRSIVAILISVIAVGCARAPTVAPPSAPTAASTSAPSPGPATPAPSPTATPLPAPTLGASLTLQDLHATFAYAICEQSQCDVHVIGAAGVD